MAFLNKILPHKKEQYIMNVTKKNLHMTLKRTKVKENIKFEIINEDNLEFYQPKDGFFDLKKLMKGNKKIFLGASINHEAAGFAGIVYKNGKSCYFKIVSDAYFEGLYTYEKFRNLGIMSNLILKLYIEFLEKRDIERITLCVRTDNLPAIQLYQKLGFEIERKVIFWMKKKIIFPYYKV